MATTDAHRADVVTRPSAPTGVTPASPRSRRLPSHLALRVVCVLEAMVYLVLFGSWRSWLSPWVTVPDGVDHGWDRTPELHRWADSAAAAFFLALAAALLVLAVRPGRRSGLLAWVVALTVLMGASSVVSILVQQHDGPVGALMSGATTVLVLAGPLVLAAPDRGLLLRLGRPDGAAEARAPWVSGLALAGLVGWSAVALGAVISRLAGVTFESPLEDDTIGLVMLSAAGALGCWLVLRKREGWRPLGRVVGAMTLYAVLGAASLALAG